MAKKFVVAASPLTEGESSQITNGLRDKYGWWHYIDGFWLIVDSSHALTSKSIADWIHGISPVANIMVFEITGATAWYGYGPKDRDMFDWLRRTWDSDALLITPPQYRP